MNKKTYDLVKELKDNEEDFEFYPTSKEMIKPIYNHIKKDSIEVLDIGCGTCNFKNHYEKIADEEYSFLCDMEKSRVNSINSRGETTAYFREPDKKFIKKYFVIEKSKVLIDRLDKNTMVLGTDFYNTTLIDKPVGVVFCNPPYSDYKRWTLKIISESNCYDIYMVIPERWKNDKDIINLIDRKGLSYNVLHETDFLNAEREARARINVIHIKKKENIRRGLDEFEQDSFTEWFNLEFDIKDSGDMSLNSGSKEEKIKELKNKLVCDNRDKSQYLVDLYNEELKILFHHFKTISTLDINILETMGIGKSNIMNTLKIKTKNLKVLYWSTIFEELDEITSRLTTKTRDDLFNKFTRLHTVDFTIENIYSLVIWVIKNSNDYYNSQLIDFYKSLSDVDNVKPYKSNIKTFDKEEWRWNSFKHSGTKYVLDYRIICGKYLLDVNKDSWSGKLNTGWDYDRKIKDIEAIFNNLGFNILEFEKCLDFGVKYYAYGKNKEKMLEYKVYKNGNLHFKFNIEFTKAMNVEVSRLLGWIKSKEDIKKEFPDELAKGSEKYFKCNNNISLVGGVKLLESNYS